MPPAKVLIFSDIHNDFRALERLAETDADCYVAAGDLATWGRGLERCGTILAARGPERVWVLPGNHESDDMIARFCAKFGFHDFHGRSFELAGRQIAGLGYSSPTPFNTPGEYKEPEFERRLAPFEGLNPLVLICHCPPLGTPLDRIREGMHGGSRAIREFIERRRPERFFCGHIHEAEGVSATVGGTPCLNVGKRGYLLELAEEGRAGSAG